METQTFFPSANRRVLIGTVTKQATTARICIAIRMPLTGESLASCPDWVSRCFDAVSEYSREMLPEIEQIADLTVSFNNDKPKGELFANPNAKIPSAELKAFIVQRCGEDDNPDVELAFKLYAPFSRDFWKWAGEMCGHEVYMAFPKSLGEGVAVQPASGKLLEDEDTPTAAEVAALANDTKPKPGSPEFEDGVRKSLGAVAAKPRMERVESPKPKKSGPTELKAFHEKQKPNGRRGLSTVN